MWQGVYISKHLMLLFNWSNQDREWSVSFISKHLMLLFNSGSNAFCGSSSSISKHLMLLFNVINPIRFPGYFYFKTSHVIV